MPQATGSRSQVGYITEVTFGTTPATPQLQALEYVSFGLEANVGTLTDNSLTSTRQRSSARRSSVSSEGNVDVVFAPDNYDDFLESVMNGAWATNVLKIGNTRKSFTVEQGFPDIAQYRVFRGVVVDSLKLSATTNDYVKASFGLKGLTATALSATSLDASYTAVPVKTKFFHEGGTFNEGGSAIAYLSSIELEVKNSANTSFALGATGARDITVGMADVSGKVTALFEDAALYNKFINGTSSSMSFTIASGAETLTFLVPKIQYLKGSIPVSGEGPLVVELEFQGLYDTTEATTLKITRV